MRERKYCSVDCPRFVLGDIVMSGAPSREGGYFLRAGGLNFEDPATQGTLRCHRARSGLGSIGCRP